MNRKGEIELREIIYGIIGAVIVVALIYAIFYSGIVERIKTMIPGYNMNKPPIVDNEIIKYDLTLRKAQWYDGVKFYDFDKGIAKVGKKELEQDTLRKEFEDGWFYNLNLKEKNKAVVINPRIDFIKKIYSLNDDVYQKMPLLEACIENSLSQILSGKHSEIRIDLLREKSNQCIVNPNSDTHVFGEVVGGEVIVYLDNRADKVVLRKVISIKEGRFELESDYLPVRDKMIQDEFIKIADDWRFSVLDKPIKLTYEENGARITNQYCVTLYKPDKLKVDLAMPVSDDLNYKCPIVIR